MTTIINRRRQHWWKLLPRRRALDPGELISHSSTVAVEAGVQINTGVEMTDNDRDHLASHQETTKRAFEMNLVTNATGPWSPLMNNFVGMELPLEHILALIVVLEINVESDISTAAIENRLYFTQEEPRKDLTGRFQPILLRYASEHDPVAIHGIGVAAVKQEYRNLMSTQPPTGHRVARRQRLE